MTDANHSCAQCDQLHAQLAEKETELVQLRARLEELGRHDSMTGALNRRSLLEALVAELQRAQRTGHPFCFAVLELDRFGEVSGQYGRLAGDAVLKKSAETANKLLRTVDRFGRLGEQSFGIVLPATWLDQGTIAMERLAKAIAACDWAETAPGLALTFSAGLTTNTFGDSAESIIKRAEQAMRQAQDAGGARTIQVEEALPAGMPGA